ncbi:hypothetical protein SXCC_03049 [Gluconacetobacter sp. SXCC-1]|nr:hypothetical protein SXCC_03049 [Gluconacetobacter sp. SXCC-1]
MRQVNLRWELRFIWHFVNPHRYKAAQHNIYCNVLWERLHRFHAVAVMSPGPPAGMARRANQHDSARPGRKTASPRWRADPSTHPISAPHAGHACRRCTAIR